MITNISSNTRLYGVIGDPIAHSLSPLFQNYFINKRKIDAVYLPLKITTDSLSASIRLLRDNFSGFNVTIPHKESIMEYLDEIHPLAQEYGAVNTVKILDKRLIGYNTDGLGFTRSLEKAGLKLEGRDVVLIGAGGAAKVIAAEIIRLGGRLTIANRSIDRALNIRDELNKLYKANIGVVELGGLNKSFSVVINSSPVGMYPNVDEIPIRPDLLQNTDLVYDVIYRPFETKLLKLGRESGARTINGLPMLIYQGLKSFEIWTGKPATEEEENEIYRLLKNKM